jgi:hypothetical protein
MVRDRRARERAPCDYSVSPRERAVRAGETRTWGGNPGLVRRSRRRWASRRSSTCRGRSSALARGSWIRSWRRCRNSIAAWRGRRGSTSTAGRGDSGCRPPGSSRPPRLKRSAVGPVCPWPSACTTWSALGRTGRHGCHGCAVCSRAPAPTRCPQRLDSRAPWVDASGVYPQGAATNVPARPLAGSWVVPKLSQRSPDGNCPIHGTRPLIPRSMLYDANEMGRRSLRSLRCLFNCRFRRLQFFQ